MSIEYCSKSETRVSGPFEFGDRPIKGGRPKLSKALDALNLDED